jgi:hypothetical protein
MADSGDATARFNLEVNAKAQGLDEAAAAGAKLQATIAKDIAELRALERQMKQLQGGTQVDIAAQKAVQEQIDAKKASIAANTEAAVKLGVDLDDAAAKAKAQAAAEKAAAKEQEAAAKKAADEKAKADEQAAEQAKAAAKEQEKQQAAFLTRQRASLQAVKSGVQGQIEAQKDAASKTASAQVQAALQAGSAQQMIAAAVAAVLAVVVVAIAKLSEFALACADAARSAAILREAATGSAAGAERLGAEVGRLAGRLATPRAEIEQLALALARSGLQGAVLERAMSAIATTSAVMGQAAGGALQGIIDRSRQSKRFLVNALDLQGTGIKIQDIAGAVAKRMGVSVGTAMAAIQNGQVKLADGIAALDDVVLAKFGPLAARQMLALPTQILKAKEALTAMFAGVKIEGFLEALHGVLGLLNENTVSGRALKMVVETMLNPLFDAIGQNGGLARAFFQGMIIGALIVAINIQKIRNAWNEAFGGGAQSQIFTVENALKAGQIAFYGVVAVVSVLTAALAVLALMMALVALPFVVLGVAAYLAFTGIVAGVKWVSNAISQLSANLNGVVDGFVDAGKNAVLGFVNKLIDGVSAAAAAGKQLAKAALAGVVGTLIISSPSRAMGQLAEYTHEGYTNEIEAAEPVVQAAMASTFAPPDPSAAGGPAGKGATATGADGAGGLALHFHGDIHLGGRKMLRDPQLEAEMAELLRRAAQRAGLRS